MNRFLFNLLLWLLLLLYMPVPVQVHAAGTWKDSAARAPVEKLVMDDVSQEELEFIGSLEGLQELEVVIINDGGINLTPLANLQELQELNISLGGKCGRKTDLSQLGELKQLKKLTIFGYSGDLSFIHGMENLQELKIQEAYINDLSFIKGLTELRYLTLACVNDSDFAYLDGMTKMNMISIQGYSMRNFECLGEMKYLTSVRLADVGMGKETVYDIDLNVLAEAGSLSELFIQGMHITDVTPISRLKNLEEIVFVDTGITNVNELKDLENLTNLEIYGYGLYSSIQESDFPGLERFIAVRDIPDCYCP